MKQYKLKFADESDRPQVESWIGKDAYLPSLKYPTAQVLTAYDESGAQTHLPFHRVLLLGAVASKPGTVDFESIAALRDLIKGCQVVCSSHGIKEIYFQVSDDKLADVAMKHGFEEVEFKMLRMRL